MSCLLWINSLLWYLYWACLAKSCITIINIKTAACRIHPLFVMNSSLFLWQVMAGEGSNSTEYWPCIQAHLFGQLISLSCEREQSISAPRESVTHVTGGSAEGHLPDSDAVGWVASHPRATSTTSQRAEQQHLRRRWVRCLVWMWLGKQEQLLPLSRVSYKWHSGKEESKVLFADGWQCSPQSGLRSHIHEQNALLLATEFYTHQSPRVWALKWVVTCDTVLILSFRGWQKSRVTSLGFLQGHASPGRRHWGASPLLFMMQPYTSRFDLLVLAKLETGMKAFARIKWHFSFFQA